MPSSSRATRRPGARFTALAAVLAVALVALLVPRNDALGQDPRGELSELESAGIVEAPLVDAVVDDGNVEALVQYNDAGVVRAADIAKARLGITEDTAPILNQRARGFEDLKDSVHDAAPGITVLQDYTNFGVQYVRFPSPEALAQFASHPSVRSVTAVREYSTQLTQSLPLIEQPLAEASGHTGAGVGVAVLDTGVDYLQPHFGCTAVATPASTCRVVYAADIAADDGLRDTASMHGTNVSGIVLAVAPDARLVVLDVFQGSTSNDTILLAALDFVVENRALYNIRAVNMSLGQDDHYTSACVSSPYATVFASLRSAGVIPVVSAGNAAAKTAAGFIDGVSYPACTAGALSVGAVYDSSFNPPTWSCQAGTQDMTAIPDKIVCFSQSGPTLEMLAPGAQISAAGKSSGGTSQAAPHVSGAVAVLAEAVPGQDANQREASLTSTGPTILDPRNGISRHRLDLCAALIDAGANCSGPVSTNDDRTEAFEVTGFPALYREITVDFTTEQTDPVPSCRFSGTQQSASAWWVFTTGTAGTFTAKTVNSHYPESNNDTEIAVYRAQGNTFTEVACNEDIDSATYNFLSQVTTDLQGGTTYYVGVTGYAATGGGYLVLNMDYTGSLDNQSAPSTALRFSQQPQSRPEGFAQAPISVEAIFPNGQRNTDDDDTVVTLGLDGAGTFSEASAQQASGIFVTSGDPAPGQVSALEALFPGAAIRAAFHPGEGIASLSSETGLTPPSGHSPEQIANQFIASLAPVDAFGPGVTSTFATQKVDTTPATGLTVVGYRQEVAGLDVFDAYAKVTVAPDGRVMAFSSTMKNATTIAPTTATYTAEDALALVEAAIGPRIPLDAPATSAEQRINDALTPRVTETAYFDGAVLRPGYVVYLPQQDDYWMVLVDRESGALVSQQSMQAHAGPEGTVFLENPEAGPRVVVPFEGEIPGHEQWVSEGVCGGLSCTLGNNTTTYSRPLGLTSSPFFAYSDDTTFNFPWADGWATLGSSGFLDDMDAAITNLFFFVNMSHDWFYSLGFTEAAGNFQWDNAGLGNEEEDDVLARAHYGAVVCDDPDGCLNNASFATLPDGIPGLMTMHMFDVPNRDSSVDGDVVIHEYGHGVANRLIDPVQANGLEGIQARAMGEGWSDYFAGTYFDDPVMGEYVTGNPVSGIRGYPLGQNPRTYGDLCEPSCNDHRDGEIWSTALWLIREALLDEDVPVEEVDQLVIDGLKATPERPTMLDARDGILIANVATRTSAQQCTIWAVFANRGMGVSADSPNDNDIAPDEAFDIPGACAGPAPVVTCNQPLTQEVSNGIATWTGCVITPGSFYELVLVATGLGPTTSEPFHVTYRAYDATCDGEFDSVDVLAVLRKLAGFTTGLKPVAPCTGNATGGVLDLKDVRNLRQAVLEFGN